jgi:regulator of protease activity HflC (stomatin/prohibitin superfamily)
MQNDNKLKLIGTIIGVVIIGFVILAAFPVSFVGAGERGVIFNNFGGVEDKILGEGLHFRIPFVQTVKTFSVKVQKNDVKAEAASSDLQTVSSDIVVNWHIDAQSVNKVYQNIGNEKDVFDRVIAPAVSEIVKSSTAQFKASDIIVKRPMLKETMDTALAERLKPYNIILDDISIVNISFSAEFNAAIEAKSTAVQLAEKATNDLVRIQTEAAQKVATAKAEAEAITLQTQALSQNANLIELRKAEALKISAEKGVKIVPDTILGTGVNILYGGVK